MGKAGPRCGTPLGYHDHRVLGEAVCARCRSAMTRMLQSPAAKARSLAQVAATHAALARMKAHDDALYRRLYAEERARLVAKHKTLRQPLPRRQSLNKNARYHALRRMSMRWPDDFRTYRSEELTLRGVA